MGVCLRGRMVEVGILPQPAVAVAEPVAAPAPATPVAVEPEVAVAEPDVAIAEPELDVTPPAETPTSASDTLVAATFGLLRAEPDGSMVIAGSGTPGSEVEVYSNDQLLGKTKVEASGDWVLVPDAPIAPGGTELTLAEAGKQGRAAQSFVVVVDDDKQSEPLVVASTPGHASDILQGLERPAAGTATQVAAANPRTPADPATPVADAAPATELPVTPKAETAVATGPATPAPEVAAAAPTAAAPVGTEIPVASTPTASGDKPEIAVATADPVVPAKPEAAAALANVPPTIDAIEIEGDKSFFAGGGPEGAVMRLYIDGKYIADATVADSRWLVEAGKVLTQPSQRIRIDMLKPGSADVAARAEVDFKVEVPGQKPTAVAEAEPAEPAGEKPVPVIPVEAASAQETAPVVPPAADDKAASLDVAANTVTPAATTEDKSSEPENRTAPTETVAAIKSPEQPAAAIDNAVKPDTAVSVAAVPAETVAATEPAQPDTAATATPNVQTADPAPVEAVPESDVPTMVAVPVGDPDMARFASGKAIIRHGDNLWTIARRVYGAGIKYTTIYEANNGQIRNPNRIYPGQVFELPENN